MHLMNDLREPTLANLSGDVFTHDAADNKLFGHKLIVLSLKKVLSLYNQNLPLS